MKDKYSKFGPAPRTPSCMQRSYLLSIDLKVTSLSEWAAQLKINPLYAILSGFDIGSTPGVGTFYGFLTVYGILMIITFLLTFTLLRKKLKNLKQKEPKPILSKKSLLLNYYLNLKILPFKIFSHNNSLNNWL